MSEKKILRVRVNGKLRVSSVLRFPTVSRWAPRSYEHKNGNKKREQQLFSTFWPHLEDYIYLGGCFEKVLTKKGREEVVTKYSLLFKKRPRRAK